MVGGGRGLLLFSFVFCLVVVVVLSDFLRVFF